MIIYLNESTPISNPTGGFFAYSNNGVPEFKCADGTVINLQSFSVTPGIVEAYAGSSAPTGWLLCDGSAVSRTTYSNLFSIISTTYGSGDGSTTFNLPNLKGKAIVGYNSSETEFDTLGETGGSKTHTLTVNEIPSHDHNVNTLQLSSDPSNTQGGSYFNITTGGNVTTDNTGGGLAHNNLQPYITMNYIIKI